MTRETKIGILLVLVLAGVFGFLVYKKAIRPGEVVAKTEDDLTTDDESTEDNKLTAVNDEAESFGFDDEKPDPAPTSADRSARPIPTDDEAESGGNFGDPFNTASDAAPRTPATSKPRLPTMIPDDELEEDFEPAATASTSVQDDGPDLDSNDPFAGEEESTTASESDPFDAADVRQPTASNSTVAAPADEEEFAEPISLDAPAKTASRPMETSGDVPELGFEESDTTESEEFLAEEPATKAKPPTASLPPADEEQFLADDEEPVSIQARTKPPATELGFNGAEEPQPLELETELESKELPPESSMPELMLDDAEEDRYGGYEPIELTAAAFDAPDANEKVFDAKPRQVSAETEPFASTLKDRGESTSISGDRYVIQAGDNFWSISQKKYGSGRYFQALAASNQSRVPDAARMKPGVEIALPTTEDLETRYASLIPGQRAEEPAAAGGTNNTAGEFLRGSNGEPLYRVGSGDTLSDIAQRYLGRSRRWEQILEMNRDVLKDGNTLKLGAILRLPSDAADSQFSSQPRLFR